MKKRKKYLLLVLLLILPVVFYSLSYVKVSKSLGSIETPEILDEYDEDNLVAATNNIPCNKYSGASCNGKIYIDDNKNKYECGMFYGAYGACIKKYKYVSSTSKGYYNCSNSCSYKSSGAKILNECKGPYNDKNCGKSVKLTLTVIVSSPAKRKMHFGSFRSTVKTETSCTTKPGEDGCRVTKLPRINIMDSDYEFAFLASDTNCKKKVLGTYPEKVYMEKNVTYYVCLRNKSFGSENGSEKKFKVIFNANSGKISNAPDFVLSSDKRTATKECTGSCTLASPKNVSRDGYEFLGWCQGSTTCQKPYTFSSVSHLKQTFYYAQWKKKDSGSGSGQNTNPTEKVTQKPTQKPTKSSSSKIQEEIPTEDVPTKDTDKEDVYKKFIVVKDDGNLICGDEIMVTKCTKGSNNKICDVTFVNDYKLETQINYKYLVDSYDQVPEACLDRTMFTTKSVPMYTKVSEIGNSVSSTIPCGSKIVITNMGARCSNGPGKNYCEAKYNNTQTVFVDKASLADAKPDSCDGSGSGSTSGEMCVYNSSKNDYKWIEKNDASKNYAKGYKETDIVNENDCKDSSESEKSCTTSSKATDVTELKKLINICYEKKNDKITNDTDINSMYSCASDYTKNPVKLNEDTCKNIKDGTCHKSYVVSCASAKRPGIEIAASLLNQGVGTITIRGRKVAAEVKSYYLDEQKVPSNDSLWKDFSDTNTVAYEQKPAGLYYAWVRDVNGIISRPMYAVVHDADINNTLKSLSVSDADDISLTLKAMDGTTANTDEIMPSNYALLSNRLNTDSTLAGFDSLSMGYEIDVNSSKISVYATLTSDDAKYVEGYEPRTVDLDYGRNTILIKIQSNSGKVRTYTIIANRTDDRVNNNLLSDLTVSKGKISFDPYVTNYDIEVGKNVKSVNINANLASDTSAFVTGFTPRKVDLNNDITTAIIKTISETGSTRSYVLTFKKTLEDEGGVDDSALLDTLFIRGATLGFNREVFDYSVTVPYEYEYTEVYAFPESDNASVEVTGNTGLRVGANNVEIKVTNKKKINIYNVTVIRREPGIDISNDITLSSLNVKGYKLDFKPDVLDYQVKIKREKSLIITATPTSNRSDIYMYGNNNLTGFSTVRIKVVAENGNTNIYSIDIQKDSYNKVLEVTATVIGCVIFLGAAIIVVVRKKHKKMKEYLGK